MVGACEPTVGITRFKPPVPGGENQKKKHVLGAFDVKESVSAVRCSSSHGNSDFPRRK